MKTEKLFLWVVSLFLGVTNLLAQDVQEKIPVYLKGVWQMCFYGSSTPNVVGELKPGNSFKILSDDGEFTNLVMMPRSALLLLVLVPIGRVLILIQSMWRRICIFHNW